MKNESSVILALALLVPGVVLAHPGVAPATGFMGGVGHTIGGVDHCLSMIAVGLWAAQIGGRALWVVPCTFVGVMVAGSILGMAGVAVPFVEEGILVSVLVLGILVAGAFRMSIACSSLVVGLFAFLHGHAHGTEMSGAPGAISYLVGFSLAAAMLHLLGMGVSTLMHRLNLQPVNRCIGATIAFAGLMLAVS